jgi:hypothetical protein
MQTYSGRHYLGGRFIPPKLALELGVKIPGYGLGSAQVVLIESANLAPPSISSESKCIERFMELHVTAVSMQEGHIIAHRLLSDGLASGVNIIQGTSMNIVDSSITERTELFLYLKVVA